MQEVKKASKHKQELDHIKNKLEKEIDYWENKYLKTNKVEKKKRYVKWMRDNQIKINELDAKLKKLNKWLEYCR